MTTETTPISEAQAFFVALFGPYTSGYIYLCYLKGDKCRQEFAELDADAPICAAHRCLEMSDQGWNVHFGVLPRDTPKDGKAENVSQAAWLWADIDFKNTPEKVARWNLKRNAPAMIVASGGGLHAYWPLDRVATLGPDSRSKFRAALDARVKPYGADAASDVARMLRVPGTLNYKYNPPRPVTVEFLATAIAMPERPEPKPEPKPAPSKSQPDLIEPPYMGNSKTPIGQRPAYRPNYANLCSKWQGILFDSEESTAFSEWAYISVWLYNALSAGDERAARRWMLKAEGWRRSQGLSPMSEEEMRGLYV